jgi:hypothetical protein
MSARIRSNCFCADPSLSLGAWSQFRVLGLRTTRILDSTDSTNLSMVLWEGSAGGNGINFDVGDRAVEGPNGGAVIKQMLKASA